MNKHHKELLEQFYNMSQQVLATEGYITPLYVLIKGKTATPMVHNLDDVPLSKYATIVVEYASDNDMDAAILICEQKMLKGREKDPDMQPYINGDKPITDHPDCKRHLTGCYMTAEGHYETMIAEIYTEPSKGTQYVMEPDWLENIKTNFLLPWRT